MGERISAGVPASFRQRTVHQHDYIRQANTTFATSLNGRPCQPEDFSGGGIFGIAFCADSALPCGDKKNSVGVKSNNGLSHPWGGVGSSACRLLLM